jgi:hypothetical protein
MRFKWSLSVPEVARILARRGRRGGLLATAAELLPQQPFGIIQALVDGEEGRLEFGLQHHRVAPDQDD